MVAGLGLRLPRSWFPGYEIRNRHFQHDRVRAAGLNQRRSDEASLLELPELDYLELTVQVDWRTRDL